VPPLGTRTPHPRGKRPPASSRSGSVMRVWWTQCAAGTSTAT